MSLNTAHTDTGVLIHAGECILLFSDNVNLEFSGQQSPEFKGTKNGRMYLTTHRMIFNAKKNSEAMKSFSFPFVSLSEVGVEQPMFGANFLKGKVRAQPNGNWIGEVKFKLTFKSGGAIEFGQAMLKVAHMATRGMNANDAPPPYTPPTDPWYAAPPPAYAPPPQGYYGWVPPVHAFPDQPPPDSVFVTPSPPPYPGINTNVYPNGNQGAGFTSPQGYPGGAGYPGAPGGAGYPGAQGGAGYPGAPGGAGYPGAPGGAGYPGAPGGAGYPGAPGGAGYPGAPGGAGWAGAGAQGGGGYPGGSASGGPGYPPAQGNSNNYPPNNYPMGGPGPYQGASAPSAPGFNDAKAAEAAQSAYYDPNKPQMAYVPPPAYYEQPPSYQQTMGKKDQ